MKLFRRFPVRFLILGLAALVWTGCASITVRTHEYLGARRYPPVSAESVQILEKEPEREKDRLGEIILTADGDPKREKLEERLRVAAAKLGADAVFIVYDRTRLFPVVYADWWGPTTVSQGANRSIVGIAIKYR